MFNKNKSKEVKAFNVYDILIHGLFGLIIGLAMLVLAPGGGLPDKINKDSPSLDFKFYSNTTYGNFISGTSW